MNRFKFRPGQHFWLKGREYIIKTILANGELQICEVVTEVLSKIASSTLVQFFFQGELEIQPPPNSDTFKKKRDYGIADFTQISDELRSGAKRKYSYVKEAIERDLATWTSATLQPIIEQVAVQINDPNPPNWLTLYRWLKTYESAGNDIRALIPKHFSKGDYRPKLHPLVIQIIESSLTSIYLKTLGSSVNSVLNFN